MSNKGEVLARLNELAQTLVSIKASGSNTLKGSRDYHEAREQAIIHEAILRARCQEVGVDFDELLSKYE